MGPILLVLALLLAPVVAVGEIYTYTDEDGVVHFTDAPREGAERVDPGTPMVIESRVPSLPSSPAPAERSDDERARYTALEITSPSMEQTLRSNPGEVDVSVRVRPGLMSGDRLQLLLDGDPVSSEPDGDGRFQLEAVPRGEHTLRARIVDGSGQTRIESEPVVFFLHRASVNAPARGN